MSSTTTGSTALYLDCSSGISGDMTVAALLGLWGERLGSDELALERLREALGALPYGGYRLSLETVERSYIVCRRFVVDVHEPQPERHYTEIRDAVLGSALPEPVRQRAVGLFLRIGSVEAKLHGCTLDEVHFHEIGAVDSIVDIVSAAWLLEQLGVQRFAASPVTTGHGRIRTEHGLLPVPAPATLELLRGIPIEGPGAEGELVTPTGAVLLSLCSEMGPMPAGRVTAIAYAAGSRVYPGVPGFLRACLIEGGSAPDAEHDTVEVLETNIDDLPPEAAAPLAESLQQAGAVDVFFTPVFMKKNRPAFQLTVLCPPDRAPEVLHQIFLNSSTLGVRRALQRRAVLPRWAVQLETRWGPVAGKAARLGERTRVQPEYEDCRRVALEAGVPYVDVWRAALSAADASSGL
jgi:pyridinium-3,5-bisthiocarboxylic acid mononucleotide nickel chelatase